MLQKDDMFTTIAISGINDENKRLIIPEPKQLAERYLLLNNNDNCSFTPKNKIETKKELYDEVELQKKYYKKFFKDVAPPVEYTRKITELIDFDWRIQCNNDIKNFDNVLAGGGNWERIKVPHYGEPRGIKTTYYRTKFILTEEDLAYKSLWIKFNGVDYRTNVFVNSSYLGSHEGMFAPFEFDFSGQARLGENILLVAVLNDYITVGSASEHNGKRFDGDKIYAATGLGYDDPLDGWHHCPPAMGIYQQVFIEARSDIFIKDIFIRPLLEKSEAIVYIEVYSLEITPTPITFSLSIYGQNFNHTVIKDFKYRPYTSLNVGVGDSLTEAEVIEAGSLGSNIPLYTCRGINYFQISVKMPEFKLWELDEPFLYQAQVKILDEDNDCKDIMVRQFGMRSFIMEEDSKPKGKFKLNNREIRLRGANTMGHEQQCVLKKDFEQLLEDLILAKICNMNFLRLTQRPVQEEVYDFCDKIGLMVQTDLPLFGCLRRNQFCEAIRQSQEMEQLIRSHPSVIMVSYINEPFPNAHNRPHRSLIRAELEDFFKCADLAVRLLNPDRVIKHIDGDYDPPTEGLPDNHCYPCWYNGHGIDIGRLHKGYWLSVKDNWHYGCGEYGVEGLDERSTMEKYYPAEWKKEGNYGYWNPDLIEANQTSRFHHFFYETPKTMDKWIYESQKYQAFGLKLMTQAYRRDNNMNTFAYHLFIDAFPAGWMKTIMDVDRNPKQAYFTYKDCLEPVMANLRTDRFTAFSGETINIEAYICNDTLETYKGATISYQVKINGEVLFSGSEYANIKLCQTTFQGYIPVVIPYILERENIILDFAIFDKNKNIIHSTDITIVAFKNETISMQDTVLLGEYTVDFSVFAKDNSLNIIPLNKIKENDTIIVTDFDIFKENENEIIEKVVYGATLVFLNLSSGDYTIDNKRVEVKKCGMLPLHFVSRDTNNPIIEGLMANDVKYFYDKRVEYITPLLYHTFKTEDNYKDILTSSNKNKDNVWSKVSVASEIKKGLGVIRISELEIIGRTEENPVCKIIAAKLFRR